MKLSKSRRVDVVFAPNFLSVEVSMYFLMKLSQCTSVDVLFDETLSVYIVQVSMYFLPKTFQVYKCQCTFYSELSRCLSTLNPKLSECICVDLLFDESF